MAGRSAVVFACLAMLTVLVGFLSLRTGAVEVTWQDMLGKGDSTAVAVFQTMRVPRFVLGFLCGGALGICGAALQGLFRNPLADPTLAGVSGGAALGAVTAIVLGGALTASPYFVPAASFLGALVAVAVVNRIAESGGRMLVSTLLLGGIAINAFTGAGIGWMVYGASDSQLRDFTFWSLGSLAGAGWTGVGVCTPLVLISAVILALQSRSLNALALGESDAWHLGIPVEDLKRSVLSSTALAVGVVTAFTGSIGFVGLVAPHLIRLVAGADHRVVLGGSFLLGGCLVCTADIVARVARAPAEVPVGIVVASVGAPFFLWLLLRDKSAVA